MKFFFKDFYIIPLYAAIQNFDKYIVHYLYCLVKNSRINPNAKSSFKKEVIIDKKQNQKYFIEESVLHLAVKKRKKNTIKNLLSFPNVQVDIKDNDCKTPKDYIDQSDDKMMDLFNKKK